MSPSRPMAFSGFTDCSASVSRFSSARPSVVWRDPARRVVRTRRLSTATIATVTASATSVAGQETIKPTTTYTAA